MPVETLTNNIEIERYLRRDAGLHLYELGDLDDFFWPHTVWYAAREQGTIHSLAMIYSGTDLPVLLAMGKADPAALSGLVAGIAGSLPARIYCHLTPGLEHALAQEFSLEYHGQHDKMVLQDHARLGAIATAGVVPLAASDLGEVESFYRESYPGNWFDPRMLETGQYCGVRIGNTLASVAGVHVYSPRFKVAALGNIATHPAHRGRGLGTRVTAGLCRQLLRSVDMIGLNVKADNTAAIACYAKLGFSFHAAYDEQMAARKSG
jgi:ribosomal protein S18 acetylase RimI-like enzyme